MNTWTSIPFSTVTINFASAAEGRALIAQTDDYVANLTPLDLAMIVGENGATTDDYLSLCREAVCDFTEQEIDLLNEIFAEIGSELDRRGMKVPQIETINLVKTTMREVGGVGPYTRGNCICVDAKTLALDDGMVERVMCHELFHILTRTCNEFKKEAYNLIGFTVLDKRFNLKQYASTKFVSNPDVDLQCSYIMMPSPEGKSKAYYMCAIAPQDTVCHRLGDCLEPHFLPLDSQFEIETDSEGKPIAIPIHIMMEEFDKQVGRNTPYLLQPEEILAENFRLAVLGTTLDIPNWDIVEGMRSLMIG